MLVCPLAVMWGKGDPPLDSNMTSGSMFVVTLCWLMFQVLSEFQFVAAVMSFQVVRFKRLFYGSVCNYGIYSHLLLLGELVFISSLIGSMH